MKRTGSNPGERAGFSMLEMMISVAVLSLLLGSLSMALKHSRGLAATSTVHSQLQVSAERAMRRIVADLSRSGDIDLGGVHFPYLFDDGAAQAPFVAHAHAPAAHEAVVGDPDFGATRELVFALPQEADPPGTFGHDVPDIDAGANLIWAADEFSYVLITGVDGINYLQRRTNAGSPAVIASNVERAVFDDTASSGFVIPVDSVRVRLFFRKRDPSGTVQRYSLEQVIKLRNGI